MFEKMDMLSFSVYDILGYTGDSIAVAAIIMAGYEKIFWKINPLEKTPVLKKKYWGKIFSTYEQIEKNATLMIKQTLLSISISVITEESKSESICASIEKINGEWKLSYTYLNTPKASVRNRSAIHYGTALLCVDNNKKLEGQYYTDRNTTGDMKFENFS